MGRRWTASILRVLLSGAARFSDIARLIPGLSNRLLSERLRELMDAGLVTVTRRGRITEYRLTPRGRDLRRVFEAVDAWNTRWVGSSAR